MIVLKTFLRNYEVARRPSALALVLNIFVTNDVVTVITTSRTTKMISLL